MSSSWALESKSLIIVASNVDKALPNTSLLLLLDSDSQMKYTRELDSQMGFFCNGLSWASLGLEMG